MTEIIPAPVSGSEALHKNCQADVNGRLAEEQAVAEKHFRELIELAENGRELVLRRTNS